MFHCEGPGCMKVAGMRKTLVDPRREDDPTVFYVCSDECEWNLVQWLDEAAKKAKLVKHQ